MSAEDPARDRGEGSRRPSARERVRAEITQEIKDVARAHLARDGAAGLSLRAVARELGMASSAVYRYFASREELLTAIIIDAYNGLGEAVERAEAGRDRGDYAARWATVCHATRDWARANPHEYALVYGSPVPGYRAPEDTIAPATRVTRVLAAVLGDAYEAGALRSPMPAIRLPDPLPADFTGIRAVVPMPAASSGEDGAGGEADQAVLRGLVAWTWLFGALSFELFGHYVGAVSDLDAFFDTCLAQVSAFLGLPLEA